LRTCIASALSRISLQLRTTQQNPNEFTVATHGTAHANVWVMDRNDENGIDERSFRFYRDVLQFVEPIPAGPKTNGLIKQLVDAAGSIGNNRDEALGGSSRKEFIRYNEIALRSANESVRWLRACAARRLGPREKCLALLDEARQLARILAQIVITSKLRSEDSGEDPEPPEKGKPKPKRKPKPKT
jgi:four helix bundle protein